MSYVSFEKRPALPSIPVKGTLTLTYRCNNDCRHCWVRREPGDSVKKKELSTEEWIDYIEQARAMGTREWAITGGEPMLRSDFSVLFDHITSHYRRYSLNTNGTFLTAKLAKQIASRPGGRIMVALYGATEEVNDYITRNPGSFQAALRGMNYLKEAGVRFEVQLIPMKDNFHQFGEMKKLAEKISPHWRIGAVWFYLSLEHDETKNKEIRSQRLPAKTVVELDNLAFSESDKHGECVNGSNNHVLKSCLDKIDSFSINPYGELSFCDFLWQRNLVYELRQGTFKEAWEKFIPTIPEKMQVDSNFKNYCGACNEQTVCRWCPAYAWLETGSISKPIPYLCDVAAVASEEKQKWDEAHIRYYSIGGMTIKLESGLPLSKDTFINEINQFQVQAAPENIRIHHYFDFPDLKRIDFGDLVHTRSQWDIYKKGETTYYLKNERVNGSVKLTRIMACNHDHSRWYIYHADDKEFRQGNLDSLSFAPNDQLILSNAVVYHQSTLVHASGFSVGDRAFLIPGHSGAGKSTLTDFFGKKAAVLSDDRIIVKKDGRYFNLYGSWKRSSIPVVSKGPARLTCILFPVHSDENRLIPLSDKIEFIQQFLPKIVRPLTTRFWWDQTLTLLDSLFDTVPAFYVHFDKTGAIVAQLLNKKELTV